MQNLPNEWQRYANRPVNRPLKDVITKYHFLSMNQNCSLTFNKKGEDWYEE